MKEFLENVIAYYKQHKGRVIGALIGIVVALSVIWFGILGALFIAICAFVGYYIGKKMESDKNFWRKILDRLLPPGRYR